MERQTTATPTPATTGYDLSLHNFNVVRRLGPLALAIEIYYPEQEYVGASWS
jgi:hypothetical protein